MTARFDPVAIVRTLDTHGVSYILIGGMAAAALGSPSTTKDIDICYERTAENLERLAAALVEMHATLRGVDPDDDTPFILDAKTLARGDSFTFVTDFGSVDCLGTPSGTSGYAELSLNAGVTDLDGLEVRVTALDDLIRMKRAAGRPRDLLELEILGALREELDAQDDG